MPDDKKQIKASVKDRSLIRDLGKDVMDEIIVPKSIDVMHDMFGGIISIFADAMRSSVDRFLYKDGRIPPVRQQTGTTGVYTGTTNYTSFSKPLAEQPKTSLGQRAGNDVKYIWLWTEEDAKYIVQALKNEIEQNGKVKVAKLYELVNISTTMADFKFGWRDASQIGYYEDYNRKPNEPRWFLSIPRPIDITIN